MKWEIKQGDCRDLLAAMPADTFDACIADPPYGDTSLEWDTVCSGWLPAVARVLKPAASIWVFGSLRFLAPVFDEMKAEGFRYSQDIVWEKQNGTGFHADRFRRVHEHAVLFYRGAWSEVHHAPQFTNDATAKTVRRKTRPAHTGHIEAGHYVSHDGGPRLMRSVLQVRNEHGRAVHPTQKPEDIIEPLVAYSTPFGGSVLDPFAGSGTTGVVCGALGRQFVGCELNAEYVKLAEARIKKAYDEALW